MSARNSAEPAADPSVVCCCGFGCSPHQSRQRLLLPSSLHRLPGNEPYLFGTCWANSTHRDLNRQHAMKHLH
eukprot:3640728-Amphidinium_carterae.1